MSSAGPSNSRRGQLLVARLPGLLDRLTREQSQAEEPAATLADIFAKAAGLFDAARLYRSQARGKFVCVAKLGCEDGGPHDWRTDLFERLWHSRRSALLASERGRRVLGIPLGNDVENRFVGLLQVCGDAPNHEEWAFIKALEACRRAPVAARSTGAFCSAPTIGDDPSIVWAGPWTPLASRVAHVLEPRGWQLEHAVYPSHLLALERRASSPDVVLVDSKTCSWFGTAVRWMRGEPRLATVALLVFSSASKTPAGLECDASLPSDVSADQLFRAVKVLLRLSSTRRETALNDSIDALRQRLLRTDWRAGSRLAARWVNERLADWVCLHAFDETGKLLDVQPEIGPQLRRVPNTLFSAGPQISTSVDDAFIDAISDDLEFGRAIKQLSPTSGAAITLTDGGKPFGTVVAFARRRWKGPEQSALINFASVTSDALVRAFGWSAAASPRALRG